LFNELNKQFSNILSQIFKDEKLKVTLSGSVYNRNYYQSMNNFNSNFNINTANANLTLSRAIFKDRFIITAGSTLDIPLQTELNQKFQFLPDVTTEWLINPTGTIRATFFYRQNLDFLAPTSTSSAIATATPTKTTRVGAGVAYRKEFDHIGELFRKNKSKKKQSTNNTTTPASTASPTQQPQEPKGSDN
jgi:hypothetical protein